MRTPEYSTQFRRDVKRTAKRGKDMDKLKDLLSLLSQASLCRRDTRTIL
jgi:mRNA interferase YafQ